MAAEDFTPEPVEHEDRDTEPVVSVEPEPEGQEGTGEGDDPMLDEQIEATLEAEGYFRDDVPLSYELQDQLHTACEESGVPYALALAIIEKETRFRNLVGDDGASQGYMQIQRKWHYDRMERLGVTDLMDPFGNFRVGCDYLAELLGTYCSVDIAVTVYNMGHSPGYVTRYGRDVMANYEKWKELLGDD